IENYIDNYYGISYNVTVHTIGNRLFISLAMDAVDPEYIDDEAYTLDTLNEIFETLTDPYLVDGKFDLSTFNNVKKMYLYDLTEIDNEPYKAENGFYHTYFKGTNRDVISTGTKSILKEITLDEAIEFYNNILKNEHLTTYIGNVEGLKSNEIDTLKEIKNYYFTERREIKSHRVIEKHDSKTAWLKIGIDTKLYNDHPLRDASMLYNYFLGDSSYSMLFKNVREKKNLCYAISLQSLGATGITVISSQIKKKNLDLVIDEIKDTILHSLDDFNLDDAKMKYIMDNKPVYDYINTVANDEFYRRFVPDVKTDHFEERFNSITMDDLVKVRDLYLNFDLIYLFGGDKDEE
ncbi:MAG: insulinase family protein, partial [Acholeplasmatales bacterium]|nr:insulinase family protein [Acholeplasmatales bacterium]